VLLGVSGVFEAEGKPLTQKAARSLFEQETQPVQSKVPVPTGGLQNGFPEHLVGGVLLGKSQCK